MKEHRFERLPEYRSSDIRADVYSELCIKHHDGTGIVIQVDGDAKDIEAISVNEIGGVITITEMNHGSNISMCGGAVTVSNISCSGSVSISGSGRIVVNGVDVTDAVGGNKTKKSTTITVLVKRDTAPSIYLRANGMCKATIGVPCSKLDVVAEGASSVMTRRVGTLKVRASGSSSVECQSVLESSDVRASGSSQVTIDDGTAGTFEADASGSSTITFGGSADNAELDASGSSSITVAHCKNRATRHASGCANIRVKKVG